MNPGDELNGYKLLGRLGSGGFGEAWRAEGADGVPVVIKVIHRPTDADYLQRERKALEAKKQLSHPFLLRLLGYWSKDDALYLVLEAADDSLRDRLEECRRQGQAGIPATDLIRYFRDAAAALDYLHSWQIPHRDVKPDNLRLLQGHVKVADVALPNVYRDPRERVAGTTLGSPSYMAPEVWQGRCNEASDQYALAVTYVELRLGRLPFPQGDMMKIMFAHLEGQPNLDPLPQGEQAVLLKALAKDAHQRYWNCQEFVRALELELFKEDILETTTRGEALGRGGFGEVFRSDKASRAAPTTALPAERRAAPRKVERRATARYYSRMNPQKTFPLLVAISRQAIQEIKQRKVEQREGGPFQVEAGSLVEVEPILPGCLCYPPKECVRIQAEDSRARFWVVPLVLGQVMEPRIVVRQDGQVLAEVPLEMRVVKQTVTLVMGLLTCILPAVSALLKHYQLDPGSQLEAGFGTYALLVQTVYEALSPGVLLGLLLAATGLAYLWFRPRQRDVFWDVAPATPRTPPP